MKIKIYDKHKWNKSRNYDRGCGSYTCYYKGNSIVIEKLSACGALLLEAGIIDSWMFAHPKDLQDGLVPVTENIGIYLIEYNIYFVRDFGQKLKSCCDSLCKIINGLS